MSRRAGLVGGLFAPRPPVGTRCHGCHWMRDGLQLHDDADGRRFWLCESCLSAAEAEKRATLEAREKAREARAREAAGQLTLDGMPDSGLPVPAHQERLL